MQISPMLFIHILGGTVGLLFGAAAVSFRKGSRLHLLAGNVFVISMICLGASGAYMAVLKSQPGNIMGGIMVIYLVATAWMTTRREGETGIFDWGAFLFAMAVVIVTWTIGLQAATSVTGRKFGYPAGLYFFQGFFALIFAVGDIRMLVRGGNSGTQRLSRHLSRMCFAWFAASGSLFLARPHLFPAFLRKSGGLIFLTFLPLMLMTFWLIRVRFANAYKKRPVAVVSEPALLPHLN